jgi:small subunit ribosomal protein S20
VLLERVNNLAYQSEEDTLPGKAAPKKNLSAIKRTRQAEKHRLRNKAVKTAIKTVAKKVEAAVSGKKKEEAQKAFIEAAEIISKAASKGVIHKNTASRKISRLARLANTVLKSEAA